MKDAHHLSEEGILAEALRLPITAGRAAYLKQACGDDELLRRRVEAQLDGHNNVGRSLDNPPSAESPSTLSVAAGMVPLTGHPGERIGRYRILERIGEGGCGIVYAAEQEQPVRRRVALKVIKLGMDTRQVIARFEAERQALALMDHPNIAKVLDGGATESGRPFFVMELVKGVRITEYCDKNNLSTAERLGLFVQVCLAIQHAHQKGIIHRDIKPSNILVTLHDGVPVPKVIDFGIAKATTGQRLTDKTLYTAIEQFIGTPAYMSPEQADVSGLDIDTRSDIYALGVLLYELLTGKTPFDVQRLVEAGLNEIRRIISEEEPPRPSTRLSILTAEEQTTTAKRRHTDPPKLLGLVRGDLDWIVMKTLEKDRTRRYETANGLAADIQRHLDSEPVEARPPSALYRFQKFVRRNKLAFAAGTAIAVCLTIGLFALTFLLLRERQSSQRETRLRQEVERAKQKEAEQRLQTEAAAADAMQLLEAMLGGFTPLIARGRDTALLQEVLGEITDRLGKVEYWRRHPEVETDLQAKLTEVYLVIGEPKKAEVAARRLLALQEATLGKEVPTVAATLNLVGYTLYVQNRLQEAETMQRQALAMRRKLFPSEHLDIGDSLNSLSITLLDQGRLPEAEELQRQALAMTRKLSGNSVNTASCVNNLANILRAQGRLSEAETLQREELALSRKGMKSDDPGLAISLNNLAHLLTDEGKLVEAEALAREALDLRRKVLKPNHPDLAVSLVTLARVLRDQDKLAEAENLAQEAVQIRRKASHENAQDLAAAFNQLAMTLLAREKFAEAEALARECVALPGRTNEVDFLACHARALLGSSLLGQSRFAEAEPLLLAGYAGMKQREDKSPREYKPHLRESLQSLLRLYETTAQTSQAALWKDKLAEFDKLARGQ